MIGYDGVIRGMVPRYNGDRMMTECFGVWIQLGGRAWTTEFWCSRENARVYGEKAVKAIYNGRIPEGLSWHVMEPDWTETYPGWKRLE